MKIQQNQIMEPDSTGFMGMRTNFIQHVGLIELIGEIPIELRYRMVEVGSYAGESMDIFSKCFSFCYAVDPWMTEPYGPIDQAEKRFDAYAWPNVTKIKKTSLEAAKDFEDNLIDLVYIDANHTYERVMEDIGVWLPNVNATGYLAGHDFSWGQFGVVTALRDSFTPRQLKRGITFRDSSWLLKKSDLIS